jgi:hypothetical protein
MLTRHSKKTSRKFGGLVRRSELAGKLLWSVAMRELRVLLGNCEPLLNDYMEALLQELCEEWGVLKCTRAAWLEDFEGQAGQGKFDLVVLIPNNVRGEGRCISLHHSEEALRVLGSIKRRGSTPVVAVSLVEERAHDEPLLKGAGADAVLGLPFDAEGFKGAVRRLLRLRRKPQPLRRRRWLCPQLPFGQDLEPVFSP